MAVSLFTKSWMKFCCPMLRDAEYLCCHISRVALPVKTRWNFYFKYTIFSQTSTELDIATILTDQFDKTLHLKCLFYPPAK